MREKVDGEILIQCRLLSTYKGKYIDKDNYLWTVANLVEICCRRVFQIMQELALNIAIIGSPVIMLAEYVPALKPLIEIIIIIFIVSIGSTTLAYLASYLCSPCFDSLQEYIDRPKKEYLEAVRSQISELRNCRKYILSEEEFKLMKNMPLTSTEDDLKNLAIHSKKIGKMLSEIQPTEVSDIVTYVNKYLNNEPIFTQTKNARS